MCSALVLLDRALVPGSADFPGACKQFVTRFGPVGCRVCEEDIDWSGHSAFCLCDTHKGPVKKRFKHLTLGKIKFSNKNHPLFVPKMQEATAWVKAQVPVATPERSKAKPSGFCTLGTCLCCRREGAGLWGADAEETRPVGSDPATIRAMCEHCRDACEFGLTNLQPSKSLSKMTPRQEWLGLQHMAGMIRTGVAPLQGWVPGTVFDKHKHGGKPAKRRKAADFWEDDSASDSDDVDASDGAKKSKSKLKYTGRPVDFDQFTKGYLQRSALRGDTLELQRMEALEEWMKTTAWTRYEHLSEHGRRSCMTHWLLQGRTRCHHNVGRTGAQHT